MAVCHGASRPTLWDDNAGARVDRLTPREREVPSGLVQGGTNKSTARKLGISPRTVGLHRAQVMTRLNASTSTELRHSARPRASLRWFASAESNVTLLRHRPHSSAIGLALGWLYVVGGETDDS